MNDGKRKIMTVMKGLWKNTGCIQFIRKYEEKNKKEVERGIGEWRKVILI